MRNWFKRPHRLDLLTLLGCILLAVGVNWLAFQAISSDMAMLNILSLDEWAYTDFLNWAFYAAVSPFDLVTLITLHDTFGYGTMFWYLYGVIGLIPHYFGSFTTKIITYRVFSAVWLGVSMWLLYKIVYLIRGQYWPARFAAIVLLVLPGFYFYDKAFSAEFLHLALCLAALYTFLIYLNTNQRRWCYWAAVWLGLAIGLKVSAIVFLPMMVVGFIWQERTAPLLTAVRVLVTSIGLTVLGFFIANPYILLLRGTGVSIYLSGIRQNLLSNATNHGYSTDGLGFLAWLNSVVVPTFFPIWYLVVMVIAMAVIIYQQRQQAKLLFVLFGSALIYTVYIMVSVKKLWAWYLFPGLAILAILPMLVDYTRFQWFNPRYRLVPSALLLVSLLIVHFPNIQTRYRVVLQRELQPEFQAKQAAEEQFSSWLREQSYAAGVILKSPYIYFDQSKFADRGLSVAPIWGNLKDSDITSFQPILILIETDGDPNTSELVTSYPITLQQLISTGVDLAGVHYHYTQVFETDNFIVYARD